jgi:hypothetical protein
MAQESVTRCFGLITNYNALSLQEGSLIRADNVRLSRDNVIENRRGYASYATLDDPPVQMMKYRSRVLVHDGSAIEYDNGSGTFAAYSGTYAAPSGFKIKYIEAKNNCYITTSEGIKVFQDIAGTAARGAGAPRGIHMRLTLNAGGSGFLQNSGGSPDTPFVAYRYVIQRTDANGNLLIGYPSERRSIENASASTKNVDVRCYLSSDVLAGDELFVYRTAQSAAVDDVGDEMRLVFTTTIASADITAGYKDITDVVIDEIRLTGEALYTNSNQEGIGQGNLKPPLAKDLALYKNFMFYVNTSTPQQLYSTLVAVAGLNTDTFTLAGLTYTFTNGAEDIGAREINISATGVTAVDIERTALSIVNVVNGQASGLVYAYYVSGDGDLPGQILFVARSVATAAFTIASSSITTEFSPQLAATAYNKTTSSNDVFENGYTFSKNQQFEHVPPINTGFVGASNTKILRCVALRDSLIFIKEEGVYRLTGEDSSSFTLTPLDLTVRCKCAESIAVLSNQIFMLSNQGVVRITDTGVEIISQSIEPNIIPLLSISGISTIAYGIGYESDHTYWLSVPTSVGDTINNQTYVYDVLTKAWVRDDYGITCGIVEDNADRLYISKPGSDDILKERKDYLFDDHADPEFNITITAIDGNTVTFTSSSTPNVGDVIRQSGTNNQIIAIDGSGTFVATLKNDTPEGWATGSAEVFPGVGSIAVWAAWSAKNPDLIKQVRQVDILIDNTPGNSAPSSVVTTFLTDFQEQTEVTVNSQASGWGTSPWGQFPWGGIKDSFIFPTYVPINNQYCRLMNAGFRFNNALERIAVSGVAYTFNPISERVGR